ncbi:MAG TPA: hypothetical protein VLT33_16415 [Labilithrix sp.]|nr:hypothetical protein [Labilithrix sp.]
MKRALASALVLLSVALTAGTAAAQEAAPQAAAPQEAAPPGPAAVVVATASTAPVVRVHFRSYRGKQHARVYAHRPDDSWATVCDLPCTVDSPVGTELRITIGNYEEEPHSFIVPGDVGPEMDVEVKPASVGPVVGGIVMMGTGGVFVLVGLVAIAIANAERSLRGADDLQTVGIVVTGIGAATAAGGLLWLLNRSHEPRTTEKPHRPGSRVYGRNETLLGDVAAARPRDPTSSVPAPLAPLRLGFTF